MADYQEMYLTLFRAMTKSIEILQLAQQKTEELYLSAEEPEIVPLILENDQPNKEN